MTISQEEIEQTRNNFIQLTTSLGLIANVKAKTENEYIYLNVKTEDPGRLIGRNGQTLNALQHLLNGILLNKKKNFPRVLIDVEGYQEKRRNSIKEKVNKDFEKTRKRALDAVKEVKKWGEKVVLSPMNEEELSLVHNTLKEEKEVELICENGNKDGNKRIIIQLKKF